jgi:hypothetical protein
MTDHQEQTDSLVIYLTALYNCTDRVASSKFTV